MAPELLATGGISSFAAGAAHAIPEGFSGKVVPGPQFGNVELDGAFTGPASRGSGDPYFSQLQNLWDMVQIYTPYAPPPVRRIVFVSVVPTPFDDPTSALHRGRGVIKGTRGAVGAARNVLAEQASQALTLIEVTEQMRSLVDLPVQDIARMSGVGRRQYYNFLRGNTQKSPDERRIRRLHRMLLELHATLHDPMLVRAATLLPLESCELRSFVDEASTGDEVRMDAAFRELSERLDEAAELKNAALPPSGTFPAGDERLREAAAFLRDYRVPDKDPAS